MQAMNVTHSSSQGLPDSGQYLTLRLGSEEYAIDILRAQEIRSYEEPTRMVNAPPSSRGWSTCVGSSFPSWTCA